MPTGPLEKDAHPSWERARLSAVMPVVLIVVVAIACVLTAVLSSAHRADVVAVEQEHQLFNRALNDRRLQVLREAENIVTSN
jgi:diguanylate cyclase